MYYRGNEKLGYVWLSLPVVFLPTTQKKKQNASPLFAHVPESDLAPNWYASTRKHVSFVNINENPFALLSGAIPLPRRPAGSSGLACPDTLGRGEPGACVLSASRRRDSEATTASAAPAPWWPAALENGDGGETPPTTAERLASMVGKQGRRNVHQEYLRNDPWNGLSASYPPPRNL